MDKIEITNDILERDEEEYYYMDTDSVFILPEIAEDEDEDNEKLVKKTIEELKVNEDELRVFSKNCNEGHLYKLYKRIADMIEDRSEELEELYDLYDEIAKLLEDHDDKSLYELYDTVNDLMCTGEIELEKFNTYYDFLGKLIRLRSEEIEEI